MNKNLRTACLLIVLYATLVAAWTWRLMPGTTVNEGMAQRQEMQEKIARTLASMPGEDLVPALMALPGMPLDSLQSLAAWTDMPPLDQVRQLTVQEGPIAALGADWGQALFHIWLVQERPLDLLEAHLMVAAAGDRLTEATRSHALEKLAARAMAQGDKQTAVTILGRANELPNATWETLQKLAAACRNARTPAPALRALSLWITREKTDGTHPALEDAQDLELSLMIEAGLHLEALSHQLSLLTGFAPYPERTLDRAWLAARSAHQTSRLLPILDLHLQTFPEHELSKEKLALQPTLPPDYIRWLTCRASIVDDEQPATVAFQSYLRLAATRVPQALPRLCQLATTPDQKIQTATALRQALDRPETQLTVLNLAQQDEIARKVLAETLRSQPHQRDLHFAATLASAAAQTRSSTAILWQDFLRRFPGDAAAQRRLIQAHIQEQQPALALRAYEALPAQTLTAEDRQQQELLRQL